MKLKKIKTIISGGQTGADRAALDFARANQIESGGFVPKGRRAEDGPIAESYANLTETKTENYAERTARNVENSDATLIVSHGKLTRGARLTRELAVKHRKPFLHIDFTELTIDEAVEQTRQWLASINCRRLNVAGSRASTDARIYDKTREFLAALFGVE
jgi:hypothetical protein